MFFCIMVSPCRRHLFASTGPCPLVLCGPSGSGKSTIMKKVKVPGPLIIRSFLSNYVPAFLEHILMAGEDCLLAWGSSSLLWRSFINQEIAECILINPGTRLVIYAPR